jgi:DnaJ-class molecular chaperone
LTKAVEVLTDAAERAKYDLAHAAKVAKQKRMEQAGQKRSSDIAGMYIYVPRK